MCVRGVGCVCVCVCGCGWVGVKGMVLSTSLVDEPISDVLCTYLATK